MPKKKVVKKEKPKKPHFDIVFCTPSGKDPVGFYRIWDNARSAGYSCARPEMHYNANVYLARGACLGNNSLNADIHRPLFEDKITYKYLVWLDTDIVLSFAHIDRLIKQDKDICSGIYHMKCKDKYACVEVEDKDYYMKHGSYEFLTDEDITIFRHLIKRNQKKETDKKAYVDSEGYNIKHSLLSVFYNGMGCMVVKQGVFEKVGYPYFRPWFFTLPNGVTDFGSEDVSFCVHAKEAGFTTYIDTGVVCGHEKSYIV